MPRMPKKRIFERARKGNKKKQVWWRRQHERCGVGYGVWPADGSYERNRTFVCFLLFDLDCAVALSSDGERRSAKEQERGVERVSFVVSFIFFLLLSKLLFFRCKCVFYKWYHKMNQDIKFLPFFVFYFVFWAGTARDTRLTPPHERDQIFSCSSVTYIYVRSIFTSVESLDFLYFQNYTFGRKKKTVEKRNIIRNICINQINNVPWRTEKLLE